MRSPLTKIPQKPTSEQVIHRSLPHIDGKSVIQHITYRLADSVPKHALERLIEQERQIGRSPEESWRLRERIENFMDAGYGSCILREPEIAEMIVTNWNHFDAERYDLLAYVVMPNHCHVLIQTRAMDQLPRIVHSWKSFTARRINLWREKHGSETNSHSRHVWQRGYWDRYVRTPTHFHRVIRYILDNPVNAGLVEKSSDGKWVMSRDGKFFR